MVAHHDQHGDEQHQPDGRPRDLTADQHGRRVTAQRRCALRVGEVEPVDHHEAQAVEQRDARQDQRVGVRREPAHREVRDREDAQVGQAHPEQRLRELLLLVGLDQHERDRHQNGSERQQHQLDSASRGEGRGVGRGGLGSVAARRHQPNVLQVTPGMFDACGSGVVLTVVGAGGCPGAGAGLRRAAGGEPERQAAADGGRRAGGRGRGGGGRDDRTGLQQPVAQHAHDAAGALDAARGGQDAVLHLAAVALGELVGGDLGVLGDLVQREPEHVAPHALEDRDLVAVDADVVLLQDPHPSERPRRAEHDEHRERHGEDPQATALSRGRDRGRLVDAGQGAGHRGGRRPRRGGVGVRALVAPVADRAADDGGVVAEVDVDDVRDDAGDVVGAAAAQRQLDHAVGALAGVAVGHQRVGQRLVADHAGEAVGAQQVAVAGAGLAHGERRFDVLPGDGAQQQRALRVRVRLLLGDAALVDQRLDERVVLRDLRQRAVAQLVGPRVADVDQAEAGAREQDRGERGAHALEVGGVGDVPGDRGVAFDGGFAELGEQVVAGVVLVEGSERRDDQRRGHLTGGVAAHAVRQRQQPRPGVDGILVVLPDEPAVAAGGVTQDQRHVAGPLMIGARSPSCRCGQAPPGEPG